MALRVEHVRHFIDGANMFAVINGLDVVDSNVRIIVCVRDSHLCRGGSEDQSAGKKAGMRSSG